MDKDTRNAIERATQRARKVLEEDFASQLEGTFDVQRNGTVPAKPGSHLSARQVFQRDKVIAAIEHKRAAGMTAPEAVVDYLRDAAFTTLNRFVALKMLEARELVQECITKGEQSSGYREFCGMAPGVALLPESAGYRLYIESLFDELSTEVKVLFDRRDPASVLWPKRVTFEELLVVLNDADLVGVWGEDETIGWVYQYFNSSEERQEMRGESHAPRNSRELAVRNQFFTPRYVVQFLTDNTLGRIWYEMTTGATMLTDRCEYMVHRSDETYASRKKKDPRDLHILDPACGSGHFLLYSFDVLLTIYEESYNDTNAPKSELTGKTLSADYPSVDVLRRAMPALILANNLYGVDIDSRCAQIAQLALWMRAQRAFRDFKIGRADRPEIRKSNIVVAEPFVIDDATLSEFLANLRDAELARVFMDLVESLRLAGDLGILLRVEGLLNRGSKRGETGDLFAPAETRIRTAIKTFVATTSLLPGVRRRLFADDAAQGVGLLDTVEKKFDIVLMNPPFGRVTDAAFHALQRTHPNSYVEASTAFIDRAAELGCGLLGAVTPNSVLTIKRLSRWRKATFNANVNSLVDAGLGVMDDALVSACYFTIALSDPGARMREVFVVGAEGLDPLCLHDCTMNSGEHLRIREACVSESSGQFLVGGKPASEEVTTPDKFEPLVGTARQGPLTHDDERFLRTWVEVEPTELSRSQWTWYAKGGEHQPFYGDVHLVLNRRSDGAELDAVNMSLNGQTAQCRTGSAYWYKAGSTYSYRSMRGFAARNLRSGVVMSIVGPAVILTTEEFSDAYLLGWLNSNLIRSSIEARATAYAYPTGLVKSLPWVPPTRQIETLVATNAVAAACGIWRARANDEMDPMSAISFPDADENLASFVDRELGIAASASGALGAATNQIDEAIARLYGTVSDAHVSAPRFELAAPKSARSIVEDLLLVLVGVVVGRYDFARLRTASRDPVLFGATEVRWPLRGPDAEGTRLPFDIFVCDKGHPRDLCGLLLSWIGLHTQTSAIREEWTSTIERTLSVAPGDLNRWLAECAFGLHLSHFGRSRRRAPIYWQLATPSSSYSVWLYIHAFNKDTLYKVQNEYAGPKLAHEERKLDSLRRELAQKASATDRKALAEQEAFVDELRAFLEEVKRVAPLWNPNLDDGVIINFAPLWRLVPQHKSWQKELKTTWDALFAGEYDWAHLAMHLWPERVVPKCATDRSLAIAHGLEGEFWIEGSDGKWKARAKPLKPVDELVSERSSPAVKAALKSLIDAPANVSTPKRSGRTKRGSSK